MALSNGEANAFNTVARYFLRIPNHAGPVSEAQAWNALEVLREKAYKTLMAGLTQDQMRDAFARHAADRTAIKLRIDDTFGAADESSAP